MNINRVCTVFAVGITLLLVSATGCKHGPKKPTTPVTDTQAPPTKAQLRPLMDPREKKLQDQIDSMQDQIRTLSVRTESLAQFHGARMSPKWVEQVKAARAEASRPADRIRYLETMKELLARKLEALRDELKVYQEFEASDPSIPRL